MLIESLAVTHEGRIRENNEDNFFVCGEYKKDINLNRFLICDTEEREEYLYAVCDGMGGEEFGEKASLIAVEELCRYQGTEEFQIAEYVKNANKLICDETENNGGIRMGTTLAVLHIKNNIACAYNIGDSRIYFLRHGCLKKLSYDHTQINRLINMKIISEEQAKIHPERHKLTQHLGIYPEEMVIEAYESEVTEVETGDVFLLCSDGLTDMIDDEKITDIINKNESLKIASKSLMEEAIKRGGKDNVTVIVVKITK